MVLYQPQSLQQGLMAGGPLCGVSYVIGTHYELVSMVFRAFGAKIGRYRVNLT